MNITQVPVRSLEFTMGVVDKTLRSPLRTNLGLSAIRKAGKFRKELVESIQQEKSESAMIVVDAVEGAEKRPLYYRELVMGPVAITLVAVNPEHLEFRVFKPGEHNDQSAFMAPGTHPTIHGTSSTFCQEVGLGLTGNVNVDEIDFDGCTKQDCLEMLQKISLRLAQLK